MTSTAVLTAQRIELQDVQVDYPTPAGTVHALRGINVSATAGQLVVLMGISGSGKSTVLNLLGGLLKPTSGLIYSFGYTLDNVTEELRAKYRREIASTIYQEYNLLSMLRAVENVALPLEINGTPRSESRRKAISSLKSIGISDLADRFPGELSGGQRQRVAIARALATDRSLILADEPTGSLDSVTSIEVRRNLQALRDNGALVIVATHDPRFAEYADRVIEINDGREVAKS